MMAEWNGKKDLMMSIDGDILWAGGDYAYAEQEMCAAQDAYIYARTEQGQHPVWGELGHMLSDLIGRLNLNVGDANIEEEMADAISRYGRVPRENISFSISREREQASISIYIQGEDGKYYSIPSLVVSSWGIDVEG